MRCLDGIMMGILGLLVAGCAGELRTDGGSIPGNAYISDDIAASHAADARDLRDLRPIEPGRSGASFGGGVTAPSDFIFSK
jgi:hypothetical protein